MWKLFVQYGINSNFIKYNLFVSFMRFLVTEKKV